MPAATSTARKKKTSKSANKNKNAKKNMFARVLLQDHCHHHHCTTTITKTKVVTRKTMTPPVKKSATKMVQKTIPKKMDGKLKAGKTGVYVLELKDGCVYVGKSSKVARRVQQHVEGNGYLRLADFVVFSFHTQ